MAAEELLLFMTYDIITMEGKYLMALWRTSGIGVVNWKSKGQLFFFKHTFLKAMQYFLKLSSNYKQKKICFVNIYRKILAVMKLLLMTPQPALSDTLAL